MLDFRVETFLEVCKDLNFTRAAQRLNLTQPAVSQHIRWLEEAYGVPLFVCKGKKMQLTSAGEMLKNSAATMKHDIISLREKMQKSTENQLIKMGLTLTIAEFEISGIAAAYLNYYPSASLHLSVANTEELLHELETGKIDFALVEGNFPRDIYHHELYLRERYIAVCSPEDSLAKGVYTLDDLISHRLITREAGSGSRNILEYYLQMKGMQVESFDSLVEAGSIGLIKQLVEQGCGISFLYRTAVKKELAEGRLCEIQMEDLDIVHDFTFIWRKNSIFAEDYLEIYEKLKQQENLLSMKD